MYLLQTLLRKYLLLHQKYNLKNNDFPVMKGLVDAFGEETSADERAAFPLATKVPVCCWFSIDPVANLLFFRPTSHLHV